MASLSRFARQDVMKDHMYTPGVDGPARLYYQGDVPILEVQSDNPYEAGFAQGKVLAPALHKLVLGIFRRLENTKFTPKNLNRTLEKLVSNIPMRYLDEMRGIVEGFNTREREANEPPLPLTLGDLVFFHLLPDEGHLIPEELQGDIPEHLKDVWCDPLEERKKRSVACTVVLDRDKEKGIIFGRNLDWSDCGGLGSLSLVINRKYSAVDKLSTVEIGFPGLVGTFTGMNKSGLSIAMNVCRGETMGVLGMPATLFNRMCLESAVAVDDIAKLLKTSRPLGCYHLMAADSLSARSFHLFQGENGEHVERILKDGVPLITTNFRYLSQTQTTDDLHNSRERAEIAAYAFNREHKRYPQKTIAEIVIEILKYPPIDSETTIQKVGMCPVSKQLSVAFDDQWAGRLSLQPVDTAELFT
jgi:hypothetical protein